MYNICEALEVMARPVFKVDDSDEYSECQSDPQLRPKTAEEIAAEADRIAANARAEEEANAIARQLAKARAKAKRVQEAAVATAARLKAFQDEEARLYNVQPTGGHDHQVPAKAAGDVLLQPLVQAILAGIGRKPPSTMPIRVHPLPALPQVEEAGIDGAPLPDPMVEQLKIVEAEKAKAKEFADQVKLQKEKEASQYDKERDYSF